MIIAGDNHTFLIDSDGKILSCGQNGSGQLGLSSNDIETSFKLISTELSPAKRSSPDRRLTIKAISVGDEHSVMITNDDRVAVCGSNYLGQLGIDSTTRSINEFTILPDLSSCKMVSCGLNTTVILTYSGDILISGVGIIGELPPQLLEFTNCNKMFESNKDDDDEEYVFSGNWIRVCNERLLVIDDESQLWYTDKDQRPIMIDSGINVVEACMIEDDILIRNEHGQVFQFIMSDSSQQSEVIIDDVVCMEHTADRVFAQRSNGSVAIITSSEVTLLDIEPVKRIGLSNNSTFIYTSEDQLLSKGYNYNGQLGLGDEYYNLDVSSLTTVDISGDDTEEGTGASGFSGFNDVDYVDEFDDDNLLIVSDGEEDYDYEDE